MIRDIYEQNGQMKIIKTVIAVNKAKLNGTVDKATLHNKTGLILRVLW